MTEETPDGPGKPTPEELDAEAAPPAGSEGLPEDVRDGDATAGDDTPDDPEAPQGEEPA